MYITDISEYLKTKTSTELMKHLVNEYKELKAYRYFTCGWVKEVFYHPISENSAYCLLKCRVTPSQRISAKPYQVWVVIEKDTAGKPGGTITSAYYTCTAGLYGSCNHIAGVLFRVESAVPRGITKPTCTDRLAMWKVPQAKTDLSPCPVSKIVFKKDHYRTSLSVDRGRQAANVRGRMSFSPLSTEQEDFVKNEDKVRADLYKLITAHAPKSCFVEFMEQKKLSKKVKQATPQSLIEKAETFQMDESLSIHDNVKLFTQSIRLTNSELNVIKKNTVGQASVTDWYLQREGRLTASSFHKVYTRVSSLQKSPSEDPTCLVATLIGYKKSPETAAMKHGKALEPHAKSVYLSIAKKSHQKLKSAETGLVIMDQKPFIGVSPDLEVDCESCGKGLVEIKCPYSIRDTAPTDENLSYLQISDRKIQLKTNSEYYYQVQGQMAVTGRLYTDFVVFTCHGNLIQRIKFDSCFWEGILNKLEWFWVNCLCPELLTKKIKQKQLPECTEIPTTVSPVTRKDGNHESKSPVTNCDSSGFQITSRVRVSSHRVSLSASYNSKADPVQLPLQTLQNNKRQA